MMIRWTLLLAAALHLSAYALPQRGLVFSQASTTTTEYARSAPGPVTWNEHAFSVYGKEFLIFAAEFHPFRLPVPGLWRDVLSKYKATGINTVSIYTDWALIMPSPDPASVSLDAPANRLADFLQVAKDVGLYVILRPGPYINAETSGGGFPGWVMNLDSQLRTNTDTFNSAWKPYMKAIVDAARPFQIARQEGGSGGTLIGLQVENEFTDQPAEAAYFDEIIRFYRENGIYVPTTYNANGDSAYATDANLDVWGRDSYPQSFDCSRPDYWKPIRNYTSLQPIRTTNPPSVPEFQAGSFDAWGGSSYENCAKLTNDSFVRVFDKGVLGDGVKFVSQYMLYGGTNVGNTMYGGTGYTSYDYGAGIDENRIVRREKLGELRLLGSMLQSMPSFASVPVAAQGVNMGVHEQTSDVVVSRLTSLDAAAPSWYLVRHRDSSASTVDTFRLDVQVGGGAMVTIPSKGSIPLVGRDAIFVPVNVKLPATGATVQYSTADIGYVGTLDKQTDVVFMHGQSGYTFEFALPDAGWQLTSGAAGVEVSGGVVRWTAPSNNAVTVEAHNGPSRILFRLADVVYAHGLMFPTLASPSTTDGILGRGDRVVVHGAYHVASARVEQGTLALKGQLNGTQSSTLEVVASSAVKHVTFNGVPSTSSKTTPYGALVVTFGGATRDALAYTPPALTDWRAQDSLPEIRPGYLPDGNWRAATLTSTHNAWFRNSTTPNVLFADEYGFHSNGVLVWQARFDVTPDQLHGPRAPARLNVHYTGGNAFTSSTFLNDKWLGSTDPTKITGWGEQTAQYTLPRGALWPGRNVFTVLIDSTGLEEASDATPVPGYTAPYESQKQPRGIFAFDVLPADGGAPPLDVKLDWIVTGNQGGETLLDKTRGPLNEGGMFGERQGWHLPGFDDSKWPRADPTRDGVKGAGIRFYRTDVTLNVPHGHDVPMALVYAGNASDPTKTWRSQLWVNGWGYGRRWVQLGPQTRFPIPPGVLDPRGKNTIVVSLWSPDDKGAVLPKLTLEKQGVFVGQVDYTVNNPTYQQVRVGAK